MSNVNTKPDHRTLPRRKRPLSLRDQAILLAFRTQGRTQQQLAADFHLSQSRISQILRRAARLKAEPVQSSPFKAQSSENDIQQKSTLNFEPRTLNSAEGPTLNLKPGTLNSAALAHARAQDIFTRALRAFDHWPTELKTVRHADRDGKQFDEQTLRQQPPNSPMLRVALAAHRDLERLESVEQASSLAHTNPKRQRGIPPTPDSTLNLEPGALNSGGQLTREDIVAWIIAQRDKLDWRFRGYWQNYAPGLVDAILGQPNDGVALESLANQLDKTLVQYQEEGDHNAEYDDASIPVYDAHGKFLRYFPMHEFKSGANVPACQEEQREPHLSDRPTPAHALDPAPAPTLNIEPGTLNSASIPSNRSNPASADSSELPSPSDLPIQNRKSKIQNHPSNTAPSPKPVSPEVRAYFNQLRRNNEKNAHLAAAIAEDVRLVREAAIREKAKADAKRAAQKEFNVQSSEFKVDATPTSTLNLEL